MNEAVRHAVPADADTVADLEFDARSAVRHERGGSERLAEIGEQGTAGWARRIADPNHFVLLAMLDGYPLGYLAASLVGEKLLIETIWMEPDARELGLGEELLTCALDAGRSRGATTVEAVALPGDRSTKNLFERFSMKARALVVSRRLDDD